MKAGAEPNLEPWIFIAFEPNVHTFMVQGSLGTYPDKNYWFNVQSDTGPAMTANWWMGINYYYMMTTSTLDSWTPLMTWVAYSPSPVGYSQVQNNTNLNALIQVSTQPMMWCAWVYRTHTQLADQVFQDTAVVQGFASHGTKASTYPYNMLDVYANRKILMPDSQTSKTFKPDVIYTYTVTKITDNGQGQNPMVSSFRVYDGTDCEDLKHGITYYFDCDGDANRQRVEYALGDRFSQAKRPMYYKTQPALNAGEGLAFIDSMGARCFGGYWKTSLYPPEDHSYYIFDRHASIGMAYFGV